MRSMRSMRRWSRWRVDMMDELIKLLHEKEERDRRKYPYAVIGYNGVILPELPTYMGIDAPKDGDGK